MEYSNPKVSAIFEKLIYFFSIVFILTLTNSIFLNQVGYFGAFLTIIFKSIYEKKNSFPKTGLELAFALFISAEILSTIFSSESGQAVYFSLKRILLIPIVYTFSTTAKDFDRCKQFVIIYLGAATLTTIYYLIRSYDYFINNLYQVTASGPSVFQYPITSSELMSFTVVILFAFLINEKTSRRNKIIILVLFLINLLALLATYKRTGWIGAAAGILLILILKRKWIILFAIVILGVIYGFLNRGISQVNVYDYSSSNQRPILTLNTDGRAYDVLANGENIFISDFDNGLLILKDSTLVKLLEPPSPIVSLRRWADNYYLASLIDSRFLLLKYDSTSNFNIVSEFFSPGVTLSSKIANGLFYVLDKDSSLIIYKTPLNLRDKIYFNFKNSAELENFFVDSNYCVVISKDKLLSVYSFLNFLPHEKMFSEKLDDSHELITMLDSKLFFNSGEGFKVYSLKSGELDLFYEQKGSSKILNIFKQGDAIFSIDANRKFSEYDYPIKDELNLKRSITLDYIPQSICLKDGKLYTTFTRISRLSSFVDPYYETNYSRLAFWRAGVKIFLDHPFFGVGDIDLAEYYKIYKRPYDKEIQGHLHSNFFHTLATLGIVGTFALFFLFLKILLVHLSVLKKLIAVPFASSYSLGALGAYVSFLTAGLTEYNFGDHEVITMVWFTLALSIAFVRSIRQEQFH